ncbi:MAG: hypothetical protein HY288_09745 [Planctomycetia bacterium]|nr:hypothetical protein [Planctomycetia bacterium]
MNQRARFIRKIVYVCIIAALLLPLSWLSQPETSESKGGLLAQMRKDNQLSQANLGEIDPASETIKLATLGMRGVAANILWEKANYYKKVEDWASYSAALEQITKLQPNFVSVWIFQGWNLSYNISVEFDDYRDRYYWVIKGIDFLKEGTKYNTNEPRLMSDIGWTIAQKIGRADEHVQFRRLFREDDDFNGSRPLAQRDNWLVGREWLTAAEQVVDKGVALKGESPLLFHTHPAMCLINYCEALEEEGTFGEVAKNAWKKAADAWTELANRDLPTVYNFTIRLNEKEFFQQRSEQAQAELNRLTPPGSREKIAAEKLAALSEKEREAHDTPAEQLTAEQRTIRYEVDQKLAVGHLELADRVTGEDHAEALKAAEEASQADFIANAIESERGIVNFDYWLLRCQVEPNDDTLAARKLIYDGDKAFLSVQLPQAKANYAQGFDRWRQVLDTHPKLLEDPNLTDELVDSITHYQGVLHQLDETFPQPFLLQDVVDKDAIFHGPRLGPLSAKPTDAEKPVAEPAKPAVETPK